MKKLLALFALIILLKPVAPVIEYALNYDYIATTLCVNKDKPSMQCNGKCHLMKELAKSSENQEQPSSEKRTIHGENFVLFFEEINSIGLAFAHWPYNKSNTFSQYENLYSRLHCYSLFRPPLV